MIACFVCFYSLVHFCECLEGWEQMNLTNLLILLLCKYLPCLLASLLPHSSDYPLLMKQIVFSFHSAINHMTKFPSQTFKWMQLSRLLISFSRKPKYWRLYWFLFICTMSFHHVAIVTIIMNSNEQQMQMPKQLSQYYCL